ncbi:MAG: GxxExxY protein [Ignavibacteriaceae bacterium]|jgi:GxxExxY protein
MIENDIATKVIGISIELHKKLGPGLLESAYEHALQFDLRVAGMKVERQVPMPFIYKAVKLETGYKLDLLVEDLVIIEIKSIDAIAPVHFAQLLTYLKLSNLKLGLLINFNSKLLKEGIHRVVNNL